MLSDLLVLWVVDPVFGAIGRAVKRLFRNRWAEPSWSDSFLGAAALFGLPFAAGLMAMLVT